MGVESKPNDTDRFKSDSHEKGKCPGVAGEGEREWEEDAKPGRTRRREGRERTLAIV